MISFKALAAAVLLSAAATMPAFAQGPAGAHAQYLKNLRDSGYNPRNDYNPNGTMRAAIQEPGAFAFYYPNLDVLNGGEPTPAARLSPDWPALKGLCLGRRRHHLLRRTPRLICYGARSIAASSYQPPSPVVIGARFCRLG
jgi:hypothetical protein